MMPRLIFSATSAKLIPIILEISEDGYISGDYAGMTGLEASYEKALMGERGMQVLLKDQLSRIKGPYEGGAMDVEAVAGNNLYTSIDIELQKFGERLMTQ